MHCNIASSNAILFSEKVAYFIIPVFHYSIFCLFLSLTIPSTLDIYFTHSTFSPHQQQNSLTLLYIHDYHNLFKSDTDHLRYTAVIRHAINTEGPPICQPVHRQPVALHNAIDSEAQKMLE